LLGKTRWGALVAANFASACTAMLMIVLPHLQRHRILRHKVGVLHAQPHF